MTIGPVAEMDQSELVADRHRNRADGDAEVALSEAQRSDATEGNRIAV